MIVFILSILLSTSSWAEPSVLGTFGHVSPIANFYDHIDSSDNVKNTSPQELFPLKTKLKNTKPKIVINLNAVTPIFIVGTDAESRAWLQQHKIKLERLNAIGYVVAANSEAEYLELIKCYPELFLANGDGFIELGVQGYPCLIANKQEVL